MGKGKEEERKETVEVVMTWRESEKKGRDDSGGEKREGERGEGREEEDDGSDGE